MIHTIKIDDSTISGKRILEDARKSRKGVEFVNPEVSGILPEGYMTSEEFRSRVKASVTKFYKENGLI